MQSWQRWWQDLWISVFSFQRCVGARRWRSVFFFPVMATEEMQWMAWKRFLAFEKGNPQRIDTASSNKRIVFAYEQVGGGVSC
nr:cleavage stimulation factor subunit 77 isoform X2 [Ipomoea batatas]